MSQQYVFTYDALGRQLTQTRAGSTMSFEYDAVGNRKKRTDYIGRVTHYTYDNLNRLTQIAYGTNPGEGGASKQYSYDDLSRLISAVNEAGTVSFTYDNRDRLKTETDVFGHIIEYGYDAASNRNLLKLDGANHATYAYDLADRLTTITNSADSTNIGFGYDNANQMTSRNFSNGVNTTYEYDGMSRLTRLKDVNSSSTLFDRQYSYNTASQISQIVEPSLSRVFGYDDIDRLTSVTGGMTENYIFDGVGNRTSSHRSSNYTYQPFNKLTSTQTANYSHDADGKMVSKSEGSNFWRYLWDYENRMAQASTRKQAVRYKFDALGRRTQRYFIGGKENTKFIYDGLDVLADDNKGTLTKYLNGPGIDNKLRAQSGTTVSYFLADHLGSTNGLTNSSGTLTSSNGYDSFGNPTNTNFSSRYQFTGREFDSFTGLQFSRARFYDPNLGRFISEDPIGFGGGDVNLYGYVRNNPQNWRDPLGLCPYCYWDNPYDIIPEAGWTGIGHAGNFSAGLADTVTIGVTRKIRQAQGVDDFIDPCSDLYFAGEVTGTVLPMLAGGAGALKNAAVMGGVRGGRLASLQRGAGRFFYDNRAWSSVSRQYWNRATGFGPAHPNDIHHWLFPQRASGVPQGIRNAGFNQMVLPASLNRWMGYSPAGRVVETGIRVAVPASVVGGGVAGGYWGLQKEEWKGECGCK